MKGPVKLNMKIIRVEQKHIVTYSGDVNYEAQHADGCTLIYGL